MSSTELNVEAYKKIVFKQKSLLTTIKFVLKIMRLLPVLRQTVMRECSVKEVCAWCGERVGETRGGGRESSVWSGYVRCMLLSASHCYPMFEENKLFLNNQAWCRKKLLVDEKCFSDVLSKNCNTELSSETLN